MTRRPPLPLVDEHATTVAADPGDVWPAVLGTVAAAFSGTAARAYARIVGCRDLGPPAARPLAEGDTIPGFRVAAAVPGRELVLAGRHRFSTYALTFRLDRRAPGSSTLTATTHAAFPGLPGRAYRLLVVTTGAHAASVRRLLTGVRRRAERGEESPGGGSGS